jgi:hypothetical protein
MFDVVDDEFGRYVYCGPFIFFSHTMPSPSSSSFYHHCNPKVSFHYHVRIISPCIHPPSRFSFLFLNVAAL